MIIREMNKSARTSANYKYVNGLKHFAASDVELGYIHTQALQELERELGKFRRRCD